jgi:hypothetical protein
LTFTVAATQIGLQLGAITQATAAALVAAGLLSVIISPARVGDGAIDTARAAR